MKIQMGMSSAALGCWWSKGHTVLVRDAGSVLLFVFCFVKNWWHLRARSHVDQREVRWYCGLGGHGLMDLGCMSWWFSEQCPYFLLVFNSMRVRTVVVVVEVVGVVACVLVIMFLVSGWGVVVWSRCHGSIVNKWVLGICWMNKRRDKPEVHFAVMQKQR